MKMKTYIHSAKYIVKPPHMIGGAAEGFEHTKPLGTKNGAAGRELG